MSRRTKQPSAANLEVVQDGSIISPLTVPAAERDAYWNGLLEDPELLKAALATTEFFPLLLAIPKALWEKRVLVYVYRTAPQVKNSQKTAYIEKHSAPFDEEDIKFNHGGGTYLCFLNLDRTSQLKQTTFSIDGPPKLQPGQTLVDQQGNPVTAPAEPKSDLSQAVAAISTAQQAGFDSLTRGTEAALDLQNRVVEKALGLNGGANHASDKLLDLIIPLLKPAPVADPMATAITLMEKLDGMMARRTQNPETPAREQTPLAETMATVEAMTGKSLPDLMKGNSGAKDSEGWIGIALGVAGKLIESMPGIIAQINQNQERSFQRQIVLANMRNGHQPPALAAGTAEIPAPPATAGPRVAAPPTFHMPAATDNITEMPQRPAMDPATSVPLMIRMIVEKYNDGYSGFAVAQTIDVIFPSLLDSMAPTLLDENEMTKMIAGVPELQALTLDGDWPEFRTEFVGFVRTQYAGELDTDNEQGTKTIAPAATA
jgi:hypothetical protein